MWEERRRVTLPEDIQQCLETLLLKVKARELLTNPL